MQMSFMISSNVYAFYMYSTSLVQTNRAALSGGLGRFWQGEKMVSKSGQTDFLTSKADQQVKQHISNHTEHEL